MKNNGFVEEKIPQEDTHSFKIKDYHQRMEGD